MLSDILSLMYGSGGLEELEREMRLRVVQQNAKLQIVKKKCSNCLGWYGSVD